MFCTSAASCDEEEITGLTYVSKECQSISLSETGYSFGNYLYKGRCETLFTCFILVLPPKRTRGNHWTNASIAVHTLADSCVV